MQEIIQGMVQLGTAPIVAGFLLYDYSKKLAAMQMELVKMSERLDHITKMLEKE